ncbi:MAG: hydroxymethylbilane synthase [Dehalococcoidia bacterium]|nr:hydroxymethylbilane synthase [Dehalococcoidia bacterium]
MSVLRIATRASALALAQAEEAAAALRAREPALVVELVHVRSEGDADRTSSLRVIGGRGVFVRAVEDALRRGEADVAAHSLKDVPTQPLDDLVLAAMLPRADPRDALVAGQGRRLAALPEGARIGTGSPRRAALLRALRPDVQVVDVRGNVDTRIGKVARGELDGVVVAAAGLARLGRLDVATQLFAAHEFLPAPGQGAIALQCRADDAAMRARLAAIDDGATRVAVEAERAFLGALGAGCTLPVGAYAEVDGDVLVLRAMLGSDAEAGVPAFGDATGRLRDATAIGRGLAERLLAGVAP